MSLTTITIGANSYQSYATVAEADAYLAVDPTRSAAWALLTDDQKGTFLVSATRRIDLLNFAGTKTDSTQTTKWPRTGVTCNGVAVDPDTIPVGIEQATELLAGTINLDATASNSGTTGSNIKRAKAGSAEVEFFRPTNGVALQDATAFSLLSCFLGGNTIGFGCATGTDGTSSFEDAGSPGLSDGWP